MSPGQSDAVASWCGAAVGAATATETATFRALPWTTAVVAGLRRRDGSVETAQRLRANGVPTARCPQPRPKICPDLPIQQRR